MRQITIETHSITVIRAGKDSLSTYCEHCRKEVAVLTPGQIAEIFQTTLTDIFCRIGAEQIHLTRNECGTALICGDSLGMSSNK